jgi:DNA-directed RNA polymerase sigma subunit (sigma70/sigma32)
VSSENKHLADYLEKVRQIPLLTSGEERESLKRAREGDESARRRVIEGYLEVTALLALRLAPDWMRPLDAIQEGNIVLLRLVDDVSVAVPAARLSEALVAHFAEVARRLGR